MEPDVIYSKEYLYCYFIGATTGNRTQTLYEAKRRTKTNFDMEL